MSENIHFAKSLRIQTKITINYFLFLYFDLYQSHSQRSQCKPKNNVSRNSKALQCYHYEEIANDQHPGGSSYWYKNSCNSFDFKPIF